MGGVVVLLISRTNAVLFMQEKLAIFQSGLQTVQGKTDWNDWDK